MTKLVFEMMTYVQLLLCTLLTSSHANPIKLFSSLMKNFFRFFDAKLGHLVINNFFIYNKHASLTAKIEKKIGYIFGF